MDVNGLGSSMESLMSSFNARIAELQELFIARNMYSSNGVADLSEVDATLTAMEQQIQRIKHRLREETLAIPKAKKLIEASLQQQQKLQHMSAHVPSYLSERNKFMDNNTSTHTVIEESIKQDYAHGLQKFEEEHAPLLKEKKGRASAPIWYITANELDSLSSYMKGRLTLDKVNAAINDMAAYAETNSQLITAPRKKLTEGTLEKALELREIGMTEAVKGKHFFLESDVKGPALKLDNTGKAILTVLRHLGRLSESRIGHHRVFILLRPQ